MLEFSSTSCYSDVFEILGRRLEEPPPALIQMLVGPRQVGKTTLLRGLEARFRGLTYYVSADTEGSSLPGWWELQCENAKTLARTEGRSLFLIDEIQYLPDWGRRLKSHFDQVRRDKTPMHLVVTGSSALRLGEGARETMAGRFERLNLLHWPVAELRRQFHLSESGALEGYLLYGSYPGAVGFWEQPERLREYLRESIVEPAIGRDLLAFQAIRKPALLRQVFAIGARHGADIISLQKLRASLTDRGALETIRFYLQLLEEAGIIAALSKYSENEIRKRASPPKLVLLNPAFRFASDFHNMIESTPSAVNGKWIENLCLAKAWNAGQKVSYWREEPLEVDGVFEGSWGRWAVEIKTGNFTFRDLGGLLEFCRRYPSFKPLVLCDENRLSIPRQAGLNALSWREYLLQ